jgi:hypothetical protein
VRAGDRVADQRLLVTVGVPRGHLDMDEAEEPGAADGCSNVPE